MKHQRQIIDTFVNSVYILNDRVVLNFNFMDDAKTVTREEVLGSSAVDNTPLQAPLSFDNGAFLFAVSVGRIGTVFSLFPAHELFQVSASVFI